MLGIAPQDFFKACRVHKRILSIRRVCKCSHKMQPLGSTDLDKFYKLAHWLEFDWVWVDLNCID